MLYVFYGSDTGQVRQAAQEKLAKLREQNPDLLVNHLEVENYESGLLANACSNVALFSVATAYYLDHPAKNVEYLNEVKELASVLASSVNYFIVSEGSLLAADKKPLEVAANEMTEYKSTASNKFNPFQLAESLANRDKRTLWFLLQEAKQNNLSAEEIIGILWWQLKTLNLAKLTKSAGEAGVKDFPYNKAKKALVKFKAGEIEALSETLLALYHDGHAGRRDINLALEEWILKM